MEQRMYGVVLWTDATDSKAVIWCEDHGSLAYYSDPDPQGDRHLPLDAGDLIQFELREEPSCRRARNLSRVQPRHARDLVSSLQPARRNSAEVIPFPGC